MTAKWKQIESYHDSKTMHESKFNITRKQAQMILDLKKDELKKMRFLAMLDIDKDEVKPGEGAALLSFLDLVDGIFVFRQEKGEAPEAVQALLARRQDARKAKDWSLADQLRDEISSAGWVIKDTPDGAELRPLTKGGS